MIMYVSWYYAKSWKYELHCFFRTGYLEAVLLAIYLTFLPRSLVGTSHLTFYIYIKKQLSFIAKGHTVREQFQPIGSGYALGISKNHVPFPSETNIFKTPPGTAAAAGSARQGEPPAAGWLRHPPWLSHSPLL